MRTLVEIELRLFREGVMPRARGDLPGLTEAATTLSERLVVLLRRKMLVPTMRTLAENEKRSRSNAPPAQPQVAGGASGAKKKAAKKKAAKKK